MVDLVLLTELSCQTNATVHSRQCHSTRRISDSAAGTPEALLAPAPPSSPSSFALSRLEALPDAWAPARRGPRFCRVGDKTAGLKDGNPQAEIEIRPLLAVGRGAAQGDR